MEKFYSYKFKCMIQQINKTAAKKYFDAGKAIFLQSSNMRFENVWQSPCEVTKERIVSYYDSSFEAFCNEYTYYNCDSERGKYIRFFIRENDLERNINKEVKNIFDFERLPDSLKNEVSKKKINNFFRLKDDSNLYPIFGRFNATERAIRKVRRTFPGLEGLEYYLTLESEISKIVNNEI